MLKADGPMLEVEFHWSLSLGSGYHKTLANLDYNFGSRGTFCF
jgi:hypothetical protein